MNVRGRWLAVIGGLGMLAAAGGCSGSSDEGGTPSSGGSAGVGATGGGGGTGGQGGAAGAAGSSGAGSCTPGAKQCVGSTPRTCSSSGAWESGSACADQACVDGACIGVCSPDAVRCSGDVAQKCDVGGQWVTTVACTNQACVNGACTGSCTPGAKQCSGSTPQTCSSSGAWESGSACANQACVNGECTGSCAPGAKQCAGNMPQTCSSSGTWESGSACAGATPTCYAGACVSQPSCADPGQGRTDCGSGGNESCCTSRLVKGGTFYRGYTEPPGSTGYKTKDYPATVADFRLDEYEVTVGRFRKFVEAWVDGWRPVAGAGKHTHLNGGLGLVNGGAGGGNEPGWDASWSSELAQSTVDWDTNLACYSGYETWTPSAGGNENRPINCASWYELQAFCIWDGGFLPSETEWHYAASGGSEQRKYPWGNTDPGANADLAIYGCYWPGPGSSCTGVTNIAPVGSAPNGSGKWGQQDLAGNVWEWGLDWYATPYNASCNNCAYTTPASDRVGRGGDFRDVASSLVSPYRSVYGPSSRSFALGGRCARTP